MESRPRIEHNEQPSKRREADQVQQIVANVVRQIISGELKDNDLLVPQRELGEPSGAGSAAAARAMDLLDTMGFVEAREDGVVVSTEKALDFADSLLSLAFVEGTTVARLVVTLLYAEPALAHAAASNATEEDLSHLRDALRRGTYVAETDPRDYPGQDAWFHGLIASASHSGPFGDMVAAIRAFIMRPQSGFHIGICRDVRAIQEQHNAIFQGIRDRDPRVSHEAMQTHMAHWLGCNVELVGELYRWGVNEDRAKRGRKRAHARLREIPESHLGHTRDNGTQSYPDLRVKVAVG